MDGVRKLHSVSVLVLTTLHRKSETLGQEINKERKIQNGARQD
jgi:hypothetical protein